MKDRILIAFALKLYELMIVRNVKPKQLAKRVRISKRRLNQHLRAERDIDIRTASDLFFALGCSLDFTIVPNDKPLAPIEEPKPDCESEPGTADQLDPK